MIKDYEVKDEILKSLLSLKDSGYFCSPKSISEHLSISKQRAGKLLDEVFADTYSNRSVGYGDHDFWYKPNQDTKPFYDSGGYTKIGKAQEEKEGLDLLQKKFIYKARWLPYIASGVAIIISTFAYFKKNETTQIEKTPEIEKTQRVPIQIDGVQPDSTGKIKREKPATDSPK